MELGVGDAEAVTESAVALDNQARRVENPAVRLVLETYAARLRNLLVQD